MRSHNSSSSSSKVMPMVNSAGLCASWPSRKFQRDYLQLSEEQGLSEAVELQRGQDLAVDRDQKIERLVEELTRQAYQSDQTLVGNQSAF